MKLLRPKGMKVTVDADNLDEAIEAVQQELADTLERAVLLQEALNHLLLKQSVAHELEMADALAL